MAYFEHYPLQYKLLSMSSTADHRLSVKVVCYDSICLTSILKFISSSQNYTTIAKVIWHTSISSMADGLPCKKSLNSTHHHFNQANIHMPQLVVANLKFLQKELKLINTYVRSWALNLAWKWAGTLRTSVTIISPSFFSHNQMKKVSLMPI